MNIAIVSHKFKKPFITSRKRLLHTVHCVS